MKDKSNNKKTNLICSIKTRNIKIKIRYNLMQYLHNEIQF